MILQMVKAYVFHSLRKVVRIIVQVVLIHRPGTLMGEKTYQQI